MPAKPPGLGPSISRLLPFSWPATPSRARASILNYPMKRSRPFPGVSVETVARVWILAGLPQGKPLSPVTGFARQVRPGWRMPAAMSLTEGIALLQQGEVHGMVNSRILDSIFAVSPVYPFSLITTVYSARFNDKSFTPLAMTLMIFQLPPVSCTI